MSTTSTIATTQPGIASTVYRISVDEYERMVEAGVECGRIAVSDILP
jgi:hypothetical protein